MLCVFQLKVLNKIKTTVKIRLTQKFVFGTQHPLRYKTIIQNKT